MTPNVKEFELTSFTTKSGDQFDVPTNGVLCIVGGNNVGKSLLLREISGFFESGNQGSRRVLVECVQCDLRFRSGSAEQWLTEHAFREQDEFGRVHFVSEGRRMMVTSDDFEQYLFGQDRPNLWDMGSYFLRLLDFDSRAHIATESLGFGSVYDNSSPLRLLFSSGEIEDELSEISHKTFGFPLTLDRVSGDVKLRVGAPDIDDVPPINRPTKEYADAVGKLAPLSEQGDGVRNFLGIVLHQMTSKLLVTMLDEPEAFLHPAQCRALGEYLGRKTLEENRQLIVATHDRDFLLGLLRSGVELSILRLDRPEPMQTTFTQISSSQIQELWESPVLRFSNVLQGLFHKIVVLAEADADCLWYSAVLEYVGDKQELDTNEILLIPSAGKEKLHDFLGALESLSVPTFVVADFDSLLGDHPAVNRLIEKKAGTHTQLAARIKRFAKDIEHNDRRKSAKESGISGLGQGTAPRVGSQIIRELRDLGILVVPVGEMEAFDKNIEGTKYRWVTEALDNGLHQRDRVAQEFIEPIIAMLKSSKSAQQIVL